MTTDPTGRTFLSYRRSRGAEADLLIRTQRELGIPTWQDLDDLDETHTPTELRRVLQDPATAGAILWLTPEVEGSPTIQRIEAPEIIRREQVDDAFFVVPVVAGGLDYEEAADLVGEQLGVHDLSTWNLLRVDEDPAAPESLRRVAQRVLRRRLQTLHRYLPDGAPLRIRLMSWSSPGFECGWALSIDWSHHFRARHATEEAWHDTLLPALVIVREAIRSHAPGRALEVSGSVSLSTALALGRTFSALDPDLRFAWRQAAPESPDQLWSLTEVAEPSPFQADAQEVLADGEALAILLSVTADVEQAYSVSKQELPPIRCIVRVRPPGEEFRRLVIETPGEAVALVNLTLEAIRRAREQYRPASIHLFGAIPVGLAVLLGQRLNTLGPVQTYEHVEDDSVGRYQSEVLLRPTDF